MPNIKSAKKRVLVNNKKTEQNKAIRSGFKTEIKKVQTLINENKLDEAKASLPTAFAMIDSAASKNIIHSNNAANKKAKLSKKLNDATAKASAVIAEPVKEEKVEVKEEVVSPATEKPTRKPRAKKVTENTAEATAKKN